MSLGETRSSAPEGELTEEGGTRLRLFALCHAGVAATQMGEKWVSF